MERTQYYRECATRTWRQATEATDPDTRSQLEMLARDCEQMAAEVEETVQHRGTPSDG